MRETYPIGVVPVKQERKHLVPKEAKRLRRDPVVRDAHERDEVENA